MPTYETGRQPQGLLLRLTRGIPKLAIKTKTDSTWHIENLFSKTNIEFCLFSIIMAYYDNKHWLLSHIRNSFISSDDTGYFSLAPDRPLALSPKPSTFPPHLIHPLLFS